jgi:plasmid maintenance system antidote protein VapI
MSPTPIHPGEHLAEEFNVLGLSAAALARHLKVPTNRITQPSTGAARSLRIPPFDLHTSSARVHNSG